MERVGDEAASDPFRGLDIIVGDVMRLADPLALRCGCSGSPAANCGARVTV
jgi:hypothetical protein